MTGWTPDQDPYAARHDPHPNDPYATGPTDPYAGRAAAPVGPGWGQPGAPVPMYQPYPNPGSWEPARYAARSGLPGPALAATILGYVLAGLLLVAGLFLFLGASIVAGLEASFDSVAYSSREFFLDGALNWFAVALLVAGGVLVATHRPVGRVLFLAGAGLDVVLAVYWVARFPVGYTIAWALLFAALAVVGGILVLQPGVTRWFASPAPVRPGPPPFPTDAWGRPFGS